MIAVASAFWLGILTSISPCPLATNIAAVSFLSRKITRPNRVLYSGVAYTLGRMFTYAVLGVAIITSLVNIPLVANFLQKYMNMILGPILLIVGLFLFDLIKFNLPSFTFSPDKQSKLAKAGTKGAFALGVVFALSFCPISAALFFGSLIPLSLNSTYGVGLPLVYGIGTGLPVMLFAVSIAWGVKSVSRWFERLTQFELYMRKATGIIFVAVGLYYTWLYIIIALF